jgi:hypothetical protein
MDLTSQPASQSVAKQIPRHLAVSLSLQAYNIPSLPIALHDTAPDGAPDLALTNAFSSCVDLVGGTVPERIARSARIARVACVARVALIARISRIARSARIAAF